MSPGTWRRWALKAFRRLPRRVRVRLVHLGTPSFTVGALVFLDAEGRILLLRQHHRHGWTLPGGLADRGEDAAHAAEREVAEETGLRVQVGEPFSVVVDPAARRVDVLFRVLLPEPVPVTPRGEAARAAWLRPERAGTTDAPTSQAFAAYARAQPPTARTGSLLEGPTG